ncbi:MAG: GNAT family N-acetyltransferase [Alphaproteobacteria bacterium]|nr:GNAT family N-acetyltransferase [Alphaproteobacteria bacterium]
MPTIELEWQAFQTLTAERLYQVLRFRQAIFVVEQSSPYPDLDGLDQNAQHLLLLSEGELAGYLRLLPTSCPRLIRIGRVAVAEHRRRGGLGRVLMREALRRCRGDYPYCDIALGAQTHLIPFYASFGFAVSSEPYDDFDIQHVEMRATAGA